VVRENTTRTPPDSPLFLFVFDFTAHTWATIKIRLWSDRDIEKARKVLAGTKPGRKKKA